MRVALGAMLIAVAAIGTMFIRAGHASGEGSADRMPPVVARLALRFKLLHFHPQGLYRQTLEQHYAELFFQGFTCGGTCLIENAPPLDTEAYLAGAAYAGAHPQDDDEVMAGYGYRRVEVEGIMLRALERSEFTPDPPWHETWWLHFFRNPLDAWKPRIPGSRWPFNRPTGVRLVGYVRTEDHDERHDLPWRRRVLVIRMTETGK